MAGVKLISISKSFKGKPVLVSFSTLIQDGEFVMITGASGVGKSTLLNIIGGLEAPDSGEVMIQNQNIRALKGKDRAKLYQEYVGFIFQGFYLDPKLTIRENIALPGIFAKQKPKVRAERTATLAKILGITDCLDKKPSEASGGQSERACIARALFMGPKIILADEPTTNLDKKNADNVLKILQVFQRKTGTTVIIASHDELVRPYATKIITLGENPDETY
ncbi:ABC transporter ATP-binding protein [Candidatus Saccharibacteria bacterium]|nr:ABC transporter ATP-binding protein [Candidatus Saccharibacteria bacterium]